MSHLWVWVGVIIGLIGLALLIGGLVWYNSMRASNATISSGAWALIGIGALLLIIGIIMVLFFALVEHHHVVEKVETVTTPVGTTTTESVTTVVPSS